jgi:hypothetical protein
MSVVLFAIVEPEPLQNLKPRKAGMRDLYVKSILQFRGAGRALVAPCPKIRMWSWFGVHQVDCMGALLV